jgi:hypothetical protein
VKTNTPQESYGEPGQRGGLSGQAAETEWSQTIDEAQGAGTRTNQRADPGPADRGDAVDHANPSPTSPLRIDSILPNQASPGQSVIIQGVDLGTAKKILFNDQEVSFHIDGETLVVEVPDGSGTVEVTVEGINGESCVVGFTITES